MQPLFFFFCFRPLAPYPPLPSFLLHPIIHLILKKGRKGRREEEALNPDGSGGGGKCSSSVGAAIMFTQI